MLKQILVFVNVLLFSFFLFGIYNHLTLLEPNSCEMTYMYDNPQFTKINVTEDEHFSNYGLYYYSEGLHFVNAKRLYGAPVLFVPGSGGSYKQVRSLASVALRMAMRSEEYIHMNYFTIDFDHELSASFGGYLEKQKQFLKASIRAIENLYVNSENTVRITIIAHAMGGIVAESVLVDDDSDRIVSIIYLSTPLQRPRINIDRTMNEFYKNINRTLHEKRTIFNPSFSINREKEVAVRTDFKKEVVLISIGGGKQDIEVPAWLTLSPYINVHTMTSGMPKVWLTCDHLSILWCLQLMKVVNEFLFSMAQRQANNHVVFRNDFETNYRSAYKYFVGSSLRPSYEFFNNEILKFQETWHVIESRQYYKTFERGLQKTYNELIPLNTIAATDTIYIEVSQSDVDDWLYGCVAEGIESTAAPVCKKIFSIANHISILPSEKSFAILDVQQIVKVHWDWTHILLRLPATKHSVSLQCDVFDSTERHSNELNFNNESKTFMTTLGAAYMKLELENVNPSYQVVILNVKKMECSLPQSDITIKIRPSWVNGFDEYYVFRGNEQEKNVIVNPPVQIGQGSKALKSYINVELYLDPKCRLIISQEFSFQHTLQRIIQRFITHIPAHVITIAIISLIHDCSRLNQKYNGNLFEYGLRRAFKYDSLLMAFGCYLLEVRYENVIAPNILWEILIIILLHATALVTSALVSLTISILLTLCARFLIITAPQFKRILRFIPSDFMSTAIASRLTVGMAILSITAITCCSMGLLLTSLAYFLWISMQYKELLSENEAKVPKENKINKNNSEDTQRMEYDDLLVHYKLLQLLILLTTLNFGEIFAWLIKYPISRQMISFDSQSTFNILLILSCIALWHIENITCCVIHKSSSLVLYGIAGFCLYYCQENVFVLNYVVAAAFMSLLALRLFHNIEIVFV